MAVLAATTVGMLVLGGALGGATAWAKRHGKPKSNTTSAPVLATLKVQSAEVTIRPKGKSTYIAAKDGQVLRQGDALKTNASGTAEIDYTDGSLTRLGSSTEFTISKLTNKRGGRQTQGTLSVGETWNRAAKVSETGSFEIKAGGTTAAVEGTAFVVQCEYQSSVLKCTFTDIVDNVSVSTEGGGMAKLTPATNVEVTDGSLGSIDHLTYEQLFTNAFVRLNLELDQLVGKGGLTDLGSPTVTPPAGGGNAAAANDGVQVLAESAVRGNGYPPNGDIVVDPNVQVAGAVAFRTAGCSSGETLAVLFDGAPIGTITADAEGGSHGSIDIPQGASPGDHALTVRGAVCVLNATVTIAARRLAFTGSPNHTSTLVFGGFAAVVLGVALVLAGGRRKRFAGRHPGRDA